MKKFLKWTLFISLAILVAMAVIIRFAIPPLFKSVAEDKLAKLGYPAKIQLKLQYGWEYGPTIDGAMGIRLNNSPWQLDANFGAAWGKWHAKVDMPETAFSEQDPLLQKLLTDYPVNAVSNLVFSGKISLQASVERTRDVPVPVWTAKLPIREVCASMISNNKPISISNLSITPGASGIAKHFDIHPMFPRIASANAEGFTLTNIFAAVRATENSLLVTEAGAGICGGKVSVYSMFLDTQKLNTGLTLFFDEIDANQLMSHLSAFHGSASGRLHGKAKLFIREGGKGVRLSDAFLYSMPGEIGKLQIADDEVISDNLAMAGLDEATRDNVANALTDLDYSVLRFNLRRLDGNLAALETQIKGTATRGSISAPVDISLTINGELEQLINIGLNLPKKGTKR